MTSNLKQSITNRFLKYVSIDTQSQPDSPTYPSTEKQKDLGRLLVQELTEMGISAAMDEYGYVTGTIPKNDPASAAVLGLIAHMDTSCDMPGRNITPRIVENYQGGDIVLNPEKNIVMRAEEFACLSHCIGEDLIVTDGTTLLGGDDKAGIAQIMELARILTTHPEIPHGELKIAFTPDEEIGKGTQYFNVPAFGAHFAYTVDGGGIGEIEWENFNAAAAKITINGVNIHPGSANNKMKNALLIAMELHSMLPVFENPACTEGYEGFYHLNNFSGEVECAKMHYLVREHDSALFEAKKERLRKIVAYLNEKYGEGTVEMDLTDSYRNMKEQLQPHFHLIENACKAMEELGVTPAIYPIRGGTDGARLSFMGLPCPNLGTGGFNGHGRYEFVSADQMAKGVELLLKLTEAYRTFTAAQ